jgi:ectoine hydroxylase-related dioxygenase (phytanoyl-CoA dioxygenase family)
MVPGAVAVPVSAGDAIIHARNVIHGSMVNTSDEPRTTLYFGFHPLASVQHVVCGRVIK